MAEATHPFSPFPPQGTGGQPNKRPGTFKMIPLLTEAAHGFAYTLGAVAALALAFGLCVSLSVRANRKRGPWG